MCRSRLIAACLSVKVCDASCEQVDVFEFESAVEQALIGPRLFGKASHVHRPVDDWSAAADLMSPVFGHRDRYDSDVHVLGEPSIETKLCLAGLLPRLERSEI